MNIQTDHIFIYYTDPETAKSDPVDSCSSMAGGAIEAFYPSIFKKFHFGFCHLPIKLDPLNPKMTLVFYFGGPRACKNADKNLLQRFFGPNRGLPEFLTRQARQADLPKFLVAQSGWGRIVWPKKPQSRNLKMLPTPSRSPKSKKEGHFRGQGIKFDRKMPKYGNWFFWHMLQHDGTTPYTLYQPCTDL